MTQGDDPHAESRENENCISLVISRRFSLQNNSKYLDFWIALEEKENYTTDLHIWGTLWRREKTLTNSQINTYSANRIDHPNQRENR